MDHYTKDGFTEDKLDWNLDSDGNVVFSLPHTTIVLPPASARRLAIWILQRVSA